MTFSQFPDTNTSLNEELVRQVSEAMPAEEILYDVAELFKVFGDSTRIRILCALQQSEMCVCDLAAVLGMNSTAISHQLRILKQSKLVRGRRDGKQIFYALDDDHVKQIFDQGWNHVVHTR